MSPPTRATFEDLAKRASEQARKAKRGGIAALLEGGEAPPSDADLLGWIAEARQQLDRIEQAVRERAAALASTAKASSPRPTAAPLGSLVKGQENLAFRMKTGARTSLAVHAQPLDERIADAPLWTDRKDRKASPAAFIKAHYAAWLGQGLSRAHIRRHDLALYRAYAVWVHRHPEDAIPELTERRTAVDEMLDRLPDDITADDIRKLGLALDNRRRRLKTSI